MCPCSLQVYKWRIRRFSQGKEKALNVDFHTQDSIKDLLAEKVPLAMSVSWRPESHELNRHWKKTHWAGRPRLWDPVPGWEMLGDAGSLTGLPLISGWQGWTDSFKDTHLWAAQCHHLSRQTLPCQSVPLLATTDMGIMYLRSFQPSRTPATPLKTLPWVGDFNLLFFKILWPWCHLAGGILVPQPGIEPMPSCVGSTES